MDLTNSSVPEYKTTLRTHRRKGVTMAGPTNQQADADGRSDASIAYAILRLTLGVNICLRGVVRIAHGPGAFAQGIVKQMDATILPSSAVYAFASTLVWVESAVGLLLILGFQTRP